MCSSDLISSKQTSAKIDSTNALLEQSLNIQNNMYSVLRTMGYDLKVMNDNVKQINTGSMLGTMLEQTGIGGFLKNSMGMLGSALAGGAVGAGAGMMAAGTLTDSSVGKGGTEFQSVAPRVMKDLQRDFPGLSREDAAAIVGNLDRKSTRLNSSH